MSNSGRHFADTWGAASVALLLGLCGGGAVLEAAQSLPVAAGVEQHEGSAQGKFYCKIAALTPAERARHKEMTRKLITARDAVVETPKGYEFQFTPENVSVAELAEWVVAESKCCPFFYFHIDLERGGKLVCLGLTGPEGVKAFIRAEFGVKGGR
jgi:hypothetical protein